MTILWSLFVPGVLLLLIPADRLLSRRVELRSFDCFQSLEDSPRFRPWWWVPALWLDPLRGFFGAYLLRHAIAIDPSTWQLVPKGAYALLVALLAIAVMAQTLTRRGDGDVLLAPLGFVAGIAIALAPWPVALLGIVSALLGLFAFRQFHAYFAFGLGAITLLGFVFDRGMIWVLPAAGAFALPLAAGLVMGATLELPTRNTSGS